MIEQWKDIEGFEGVYSVSNLGRVRRDLKGNGICKAGRILKPFKNRDGYWLVDLQRFNRKTRYVHLLVASAFIGKRPEGYETNHIDRNKDNNRLDNLEYITIKLNKSRGELQGHSKLKKDDVLFIRKYFSNENKKVLISRFNVSTTTLYDIIKGRTWKHI